MSYTIHELLKLSRLVVGVWLITFGLAAFIDLKVAVQAGVIVATLMLIRKVKKNTKALCANVTETPFPF